MTVTQSMDVGTNLTWLSTLIIANIDTLIDWMQKPILNLAKAESQMAVGNTWELFRSLDEPFNPIFYQFNYCYDLVSDENIEILVKTGMKCVRASIPIIKLCRIFFNRLSQITNSQKLISVKNIRDVFRSIQEITNFSW
jgi:hypothetical protein